MGHPVKIGGVASVMDSPVLDQFLIFAGPYLAVWDSDPLILVSQSTGIGESVSETIHSGDNNPPRIQPSGSELDLSRPLWLMSTNQWREHSRGENLAARKFLKVEPNGALTMVGGAESNSAFWGGFARGAVVWAAIVAATVYTAGAINAGTAPALAGPTEWELATGGMGAGMGTDGIPATVAAPAVVAPAVPSTVTPGIFETISGIGGSVVKNVEAVAGAVVAGRTAVDTIQQALNPTPPETRQQSTPKTAGQNQTYIYAGAALAVLALIG